MFSLIYNESMEGDLKAPIEVERLVRFKDFKTRFFQMTMINKKENDDT